jgi:hypothetical protein
MKVVKKGLIMRKKVLIVTAILAAIVSTLHLYVDATQFGDGDEVLAGEIIEESFHVVNDEASYDEPVTNPTESTIVSPTESPEIEDVGHTSIPEIIRLEVQPENTKLNYSRKSCTNVHAFYHAKTDESFHIDLENY